MPDIRISVPLAFVLLAAGAAAADIERVEPPNWWLGFGHGELQLLVYGNEIGRFRANVDHPGVSVSRSVSVDSPNYLFVYLELEADAQPGDVDLVFERDDVRLTHTYRLEPRNPDPERTRGFTAADTIYLITPDRFRNADPDNDAVDGFSDLPARDEPYGRHGGDLAGITASLDYVADMGFTAIWLNPVLENAMPEASYHGYATTDYYRVDPRFGSNEDFRRMVEAARERGIGVIMDQIANHAGSRHWWMADLPSRDWINFGANYVQTSHARTTNQDPYASDRDRELHASGWFVETMPDLNQRNPQLADYLIQNSIWWIEYLGLAGIRQDTYPYPDKHFMSDWSRRIMAEYPAFNIVGEEWSLNPNITSYWQAGKDNHDGYVSWLPSVFDFPLQATLTGALTRPAPPWGSVWTPVYETLATDYVYPDPFNLVIFPDNHDMSRIFTQLDEDRALFNMAMIFYATMRGIPQLFYGTEILMSNAGTDSHGVIRSDFPGGWAGDRKNAFTGDGLSRAERDAQAFVRRLFNWRKTAEVIHSGRFMHYAPVGQTYVYFRYDDRATVMVVFNRGDEPVTLDTARFAERIGDHRFGTDVMTGKRFRLDTDLAVDARSALLLELEP